jgi:hypothetical protein
VRKQVRAAPPWNTLPKDRRCENKLAQGRAQCRPGKIDGLTAVALKGQNKALARFRPLHWAMIELKTRNRSQLETPCRHRDANRVQGQRSRGRRRLLKF